MNKFIVSDWHFCHDREFIYKPRGFENVKDMNEEILVRHNEIVKWDDEVYVLGDCMLNNNDRGLNYIKRMNGKLHIILGNHDTGARKTLYKELPNVVEIHEAHTMKVGGQVFYLSHYPTLCDNNDGDKPLKARVINLCGHCHTTDKFKDIDKGLIYHVEVDAHDCRPVAIEDAFLDIKKYLGKI